MATATRTRRENTNDRQPLRPVKIGHISIQNFQCVRFRRIELDGKDLTLKGSNATSKTTVCLSVLATIGLVTKRDIPAPILNDEDHAETEIGLIDAETGEDSYVLKRQWDADKQEPDFAIINPDGSTAGNTKGIVGELFDKYTLTPFAWLGDRPQDQVDDALRICKVPLPIEEVEEITGREFPPEPDESAAQYLGRLSADGHGTLYVERRDANRDWLNTRAAMEKQREVVAGLPPAAANDDSAGLEGLMKQREALEQKRDQAKALQAVLESHATDRDRGASKIAGAIRERQTSLSRIGIINQQIDKLRKELLEEEAKAETLAQQIAKDEATLAEVDKDIQAAKEAVAKSPDPTPQIQAINRRIAEYDQRRQQDAERKASEDMYERLRREEKEAGELYHKLDSQLTRVRELRRNLLNGVNLGVEGLEIGDGELLFNGKPFKQASTAQRKRVALAIAILRNPKARFMVMDECENLDAESEVAVREFMQQHKIQRIEARVEDAVCPTCKGEATAMKTCQACRQTGRVRQELKIEIG